jgi:hypothetical protein
MSKAKQESDRPSNEKLGDEHSSEHETEYPPLKILLPAMAAIWLAFFVVALVSPMHTQTWPP